MLVDVLASALASSLSPQASSPGPLDDFWYTRDLSGYVTSTGAIAISSETMLRCGAVLAAIRFRAEAVALCRPQVMRRVGKMREHAPDHPAQEALRNPNAWQTGFEWSRLMDVWLSTWGNAYNRMVPSRSYFVTELRPLHPSRVSVKDQRADGSLVYEYQAPGKPREVLGQEEILHYRGLSTDGFEGLKIHQLIRNAVGIALVAQQHVSMLLTKGARLSGMLTPQGPLDKDQRLELKASWDAYMGGPRNTGSVGVLPFGVKFEPMSQSVQDTRLPELSEQNVQEVLRFIGVPGVAIGYQGDKASTFASADAFFEKGAIRGCIQPLVTAMEQAEEKALLPKGSGYYLKRNMDVLMRANTKDRFAALCQASGGAFMTRNEARSIEDMDALEDPGMDEVLTPLNTPPGGGGAQPDQPADPAEDAGPEADLSARLRARALTLASALAERVVAREVRTVRAAVVRPNGEAVRSAKDPHKWALWVRSFYADHADYVASTLRIEAEAARGYCDRQAAALLAGGVGIIEKWEHDVTPQLAALAMEG